MKLSSVFIYAVLLLSLQLVDLSSAGDAELQHERRRVPLRRRAMTSASPEEEISDRRPHRRRLHAGNRHRFMTEDEDDLPSSPAGPTDNGASAETSDTRPTSSVKTSDNIADLSSKARLQISRVDRRRFLRKKQRKLRRKDDKNTVASSPADAKVNTDPEEDYGDDDGDTNVDNKNPVLGSQQRRKSSRLERRRQRLLKRQRQSRRRSRRPNSETLDNDDDDDGVPEGESSSCSVDRCVSTQCRDSCRLRLMAENSMCSCCSCEDYLVEGERRELKTVEMTTSPNTTTTTTTTTMSTTLPTTTTRRTTTTTPITTGYTSPSLYITSTIRNACDQLTCPHNKICVLNIQGLPMCRCPSVYHCKTAGRRLVCSTDGRTFNNRCFVQAEECSTNRRIRIAHRGPCVGASSSDATTSTSVPITAGFSTKIERQTNRQRGGAERSERRRRNRRHRRRNQDLLRA